MDMCLNEASLNEQLKVLMEKINGRNLTRSEECEIEADFVLRVFFAPLMDNLRAMAFRGESNQLSFSMYLHYKNTLEGAFPYWVDNDDLFAKGKRVMSMMSIFGENCRSQDELDDMMASRMREYFDGAGISVIIPTYNGLKYLDHAVQSVLAQTYRRIELIIVDDASKQDVSGYAAGIEDSRVRFIRNNKNMGLASSRNVGIRNAIYPYIAFCDDDDTIREDKLEKQLTALVESSSEVGFAYCEMYYHRLSGKQDLYIPKREIPNVRKSGYIYPELLRRNFIGGSSILAKKDCFYEVGFFDETISVFEDWEMLLRLSKKFEAAFVAEPLYDYYERTDSLTTTRDEAYYMRVRDSLRQLNARINKERRKYGLDESDIC